MIRESPSFDPGEICGADGSDDGLNYQEVCADCMPVPVADALGVMRIKNLMGRWE